MTEEEKTGSPPDQAESKEKESQAKQLLRKGGACAVSHTPGRAGLIAIASATAPARRRPQDRHR